MNSDDDTASQLVLTTRRQNGSMENATDGTRAVLSQADALMRRHRVFVAGADVANPADDLPVLTEVVDDTGFGTKIHANNIDALRASQRAAISTALDKWLATELPLAIQTLADGLTEQLLVTLKARAKAELFERLVKELDSSSHRF